MTLQQFTQSTNLGRFPSIETLNYKIKELKITDDDFIADLYGYYKIDTPLKPLNPKTNLTINIMKRVINIKPIKREFKNSRGYDKINWSCEIEIIKFDGSSRLLKSYEFMKTQTLKRDAIKKANEYKEYLLSKGDFYFI